MISLGPGNRSITGVAGLFDEQDAKPLLTLAVIGDCHVHLRSGRTAECARNAKAMTSATQCCLLAHRVAAQQLHRFREPSRQLR